MTMKTSERGLALIKQFEGLRLRAYKCPVGVWTIGYGHTGPDVREGLEISPARAGELLAADCQRFESAVNRYVTSEINQNQFDALVSFAYNVGEGGLWRSSLLRLVNGNPSDPTIRAAFGMWNKGGGKVLPGLERRRKEEADLYFEK